jgi:hypothetical protein
VAVTVTVPRSGNGNGNGDGNGNSGGGDARAAVWHKMARCDAEFPGKPAGMAVAMRQAMRWLLVLIVAGCSGTVATTDAGSDDGGADALFADTGGLDAGDLDAALPVTCSGASPTFMAEVHPILNSCGGELCHGGLAQGSWPYTDLVNVHASRDVCSSAGILVVPGDLEASYLMHKLTGVGICPGTQQMPIGGPLTQAKIQTVADWICQGAQNN